MKKLINLSFLPFSLDCGLFALRIWFGLSIFLIHGLAKLQNFQATVTKFHDGMGIPTVFGSAAVIAESVCSVLIIIGLLTRLSALFLIVTMVVAFTKVHHMVLQQGNPGSGELAFLYLGAFFAIFLAGAGKYSLDAKVLK